MNFNFVSLADCSLQAANISIVVALLSTSCQGPTYPMPLKTPI